MFNKRMKSLLFNLILFIIGLSILGFINSFIDKKILKAIIVILLIIFNLMINSFIPSPGYYLNKLRFDNGTVKRKIKIIAINLIKNLFIICLLVNSLFLNSQIMIKKIGTVLWFIYILNFIYLFFTKEKTFLEKIFGIDIVEINCEQNEF